MEKERIVEKIVIAILLLCLVLVSLKLFVVVSERESYRAIEKILVSENQKLVSKVQLLENENLILNGVIEKMIEIENSRGTEILKILSSMNKKNISYAENVYYAGKIFDIDSLLLTALINSESSFVENVKHKNEQVIGISGVNTKYWKLNLDTIENQIFASAYIMRCFIDISNGDVFDALVRYKGKSPLGKRQAEFVWKLYKLYGEQI